MSLLTGSEDVLIKFGSTDRSLNSVGYSGSDDRVAGALNHHFFKTEILAADVSLVSGLFGEQANSFGSQSVGNMAANSIGGRQ